jgi:L-aspartate oxidase
MAKTFDFLVIGGGIAGLTFARKVAEHGTCAVLFKREAPVSSTAWAQGGVAAVQDKEDKFSFHRDDTLRVGCGLSHPNIVDIVVQEGPQRVHELVNLGVAFDRDSTDGSFHLHLEGGHSHRRIFHAADATGKEIHTVLLKAAKSSDNIEFFESVCAIDLITSRKFSPSESRSNRVLGAYVLMQDGTVERFLAKRVLVATGGAGKVYLYTSNPDIASGDGIAMCYRAGCRVANMEFFQFHPTCLYHPEAKSFLITEAMRGEGAVLRRSDGSRFMDEFHPDAELAPRDVVARAIDKEIKRSGEECVYLDITHRGADFIRSHFPSITEKCLSFGIDITKEPIPVVPAAHFLCGGIIVDEEGRTDIENLYAAGECSHTGLHGANRLASNSLLEGLVYGHRAAISASKNIQNEDMPLTCHIPVWDTGIAVPSDERVIITQNWDEIRQFMSNYVGIVRSDKRLERALRRSELISQEINEYYWNFLVTPDLLELRNLCLIARLVIVSAKRRKESRGLHFTLDYSEQNEKMAYDTILDPIEEMIR